MPGPADVYFGASAAAVQGLLREALQASTEMLPIGAGWSFSNLLQTAGTLLETAKLDRVFPLLASQVANPGRDDLRRLMLAGGGTSMATLNDFAEHRYLSLFTSGSHNGPTIAGTMSTGTHGSALGFGAFHDQVRGIHLVTGPDTSV